MWYMHLLRYLREKCIRSVAQSCPTLCDPMNPSTPGLPVHHQLPEFTQTHIHQVSDAIQPSHPLSSPSPPAPKSLPASESFPMSQLTNLRICICGTHITEPELCNLNNWTYNISWTKWWIEIWWNETKPAHLGSKLAWCFNFNLWLLWLSFH